MEQTGCSHPSYNTIEVFKVRDDRNSGQISEDEEDMDECKKNVGDKTHK